MKTKQQNAELFVALARDMFGLELDYSPDSIKHVAKMIRAVEHWDDRECLCQFGEMCFAYIWRCRYWEWN